MLDTTATVVIVAMIVTCVAYGLTLLANGRSADRKKQHEEYKMRLPLDHEETMIKVAANRDIEITKATKKEPSNMKVIEQHYDDD